MYSTPCSSLIYYLFGYFYIYLNITSSIFYFNSKYLLLLALVGDSPRNAEGDLEWTEDFEFYSESPRALVMEETLKG